MTIKINQQSGVPIYLQIVQGIKNSVAFGTLAPGEKLLSVRELAVKLRVNPNTVARAYRELKHENIIESKWGGGNFISGSVAKIADKEKKKIITEELLRAVKNGRELGFTDQELKLILERILKDGSEA